MVRHSFSQTQPLMSASGTNVEIPSIENWHRRCRLAPVLKSLLIVPALPSVGNISPDKRIIKGRPFEVGFDRSHQPLQQGAPLDRKSTRLNSSHLVISYAVFCLKK